MDNWEKVSQELETLRNKVDRSMMVERGNTLVKLTTPLTSTSFDGDSFSTTAKTKIDLSAVFSAPAGISAILATIKAKDSGSAANACLFALSPNDTDASYVLCCKPHGRANDTNEWASSPVPCDANGDVYYQCIASGAGTLDVTIEIWGYWS